MIMATTEKKGYMLLAQALREKVGERTNAACDEYARSLGVAPNTVFKLMSGTIRPSLELMQRILRKHPDLYDLAMESYFGPSPEDVIPVRRAPTSRAIAFGEVFKARQGNRTPGEYAAYLGINKLTVFRIWRANPAPKIDLLRRILAREPDLYDLACAVHFGRRPSRVQLRPQSD